MGTKLIKTPLSIKDVEGLKAGDRVLITGKILTGRDAAHKRLIEHLASGGQLPINLEGQVIFYVGPAPAKPGEVIGPAGPTTSGRMDAYTPQLLQCGLRGMIGKGSRNVEVKKALMKYKAVYLSAIGGAAALAAERIKSSEVILYPELGTEAIHSLYVEEFPVVVVNDCHGGDLYIEGTIKYRNLLNNVECGG